MPVIVNPNIRYVELSSCITAEVYESCSVATIFKDDEKTAFQAKVSYDISLNPAVCGSVVKIMVVLILKSIAVYVRICP